MMQVLKNKFTNEERMKIINIPLEIIHPNPNQPRKHFDSVALEELASSIAEYGVIQPITVRKVNKGYEIIAGERRFRASEMLGLPTIPAIVLHADDNKSAIFALLENLQREDLCFFEIAEAYQNLIREQGMTQDELARKLGKSQSTIANKLRLLKLGPRVKKMIREFSLTERHARALLHLSSEEKQLEAIRIICEKKLNVQQTEKLVEMLLKERSEKKSKPSFPAFKDIRIFTNTVRKALEMMKQSGVEADMQKNDFEWGTEYIIKVKR
ncbi:MAG: nucleoid occlusion protein [Clostridia bacterium]|nr:nucleoid occlusion protein [Clostridia bacterium]